MIFCNEYRGNFTTKKNWYFLKWAISATINKQILQRATSDFTTSEKLRYETLLSGFFYVILFSLYKNSPLKAIYKNSIV